jgi:hypothetical protein
LVTYYPAEFKIARENRYIRKICMILVSAVGRPAGHKKFTGKITTIDQTSFRRKGIVVVFVRTKLYRTSLPLMGKEPERGDERGVVGIRRGD